MRIVIALGGNALLRRGEPMTTEAQRRNIKVAAGAYKGAEPYPLDVLDAVIDKDLARAPSRRSSSPPSDNRRRQQ
jgi:carbamate kinase